ncbi:uncharacterized protein LOC129125855 isoform X2 [Agelaius phoeniceus]|uniref:uncharacterized protein LOC129125855 isoform X2 n=1 Tax=Agelaius phoeniceus TaxID=39638 RepID=UPI0040551D3F
MRPPPNLSQHQPGSRARHGGSVAAAGLVQGGTIKPIPGRKNHKALWKQAASQTCAGAQQGESKCGKIFPMLCCCWWLRQFEQGAVLVQLIGNFCAETRRMLQLELIPEKTAPPATTASSRQEKGGRGRAERDFLLQKKKCGFPGTCVLKWIEMECELKKYLETEVIVTFLCLAVHGVFLANT